jgi:hypothetical protein
VRSPGGSSVPAGELVAARQYSLADQAEQLLAPDERLRVDQEPWWNPGDLVDYVRAVLLSSTTAGYRERSATATAVAQVVADAAGTSYLFARIAAAALARQPHVVDPSDPGWRATLRDGVFGVFHDDLHNALPADQVLAAVHLLRAVAFAYGQGLPWNTIWPLVANAVADDPADYPHGDAPTYGDTDIARLLRSPIGGYLVTDREDDITVYRLFHDDLRAIMRDRWRELLTPPPPRTRA